MEALAARWSLSLASNQLILLRTPKPEEGNEPWETLQWSPSFPAVILLRMVAPGKNEAGVARAMWQGGRVVFPALRKVVQAAQT